MGYTIIDKKTENHSYGIWFAKETISTTISLVNVQDGIFGLSYESVFNGIKNGHVQGGPYKITENTEITVHNSPQVILTISNYNKTESIISMTVNINVDIPGIGKEIIYNQTLSGMYSNTPGWKHITSSLKDKAESQNKNLTKLV